MSWLSLHPDDLIERVEPSEALARLRQQAALGPEQMSTLDIYLQHWALVLLQRTEDAEGVQEMLTLCEIARDLAPDDANGRSTRERWQGFEDLLEGKRRHLHARRQTAPVQLKHQEAIVEFIQQAGDRRIRQSLLAGHLQLSKGRVSQILGVLEARALITRQREGKESWISLTPSFAALPTSLQTQTTSPTRSSLGLQVFAHAA